MESSNIFQWPPLESDPEIFNSYFHKLGLPQDVNFQELFSLDKEIQIIENPIIGVIVTIQRTNGKHFIVNNLETYKSVPFYMKQEGSLDNACGVVAALHVFGNNTDQIKLQENSILKNYFHEACDKTPEERCKLLENDNEFKQAHCSSANEGQSEIPTTQDNVSCHYLAYVFHNNKTYELDGTLAGPVVIQDNTKQENLLDDAIQEIKRKIDLGVISENLAIIYASLE